ncbi:nitronate monooxygenase, partial [Clostridium perfringens]|uniref:NAD(P)H-dependent flavin oxidoreductase n=1 Tax=Clostridium perfringens TaxID=1502 RepID=UPI002AC5799E
KRTDQPFAVNLFATRAPDRHERIGEVQQELNRMRDDLGIPHAGKDHVTPPDWFEQQFAVLIEEKVPVISTAFGILDEPHMQQAKAAKLLVVAMATTVREAMLAEQAGCDAVVAQGSEAGGHRGTFDISEHPMGAQIGT